MTVTIMTGDCRDILPTLDAGSVQTCVTSPPYFGLRDYGTAQWDGGDPDCDHAPVRSPRSERERSGLTGSLTYVAAQEPTYRDTCGKCGAVRIDAQIGLEPTVDAYVAELVAVFREVRRVLRDDGTLWLNLGDSYSIQHQGRRDHGTGEPTSRLGPNRDGLPGGTEVKANGNRLVPGMKPKDLIGIPWRVAFALQADGWYLRQDIIWAKPNPMPESVRDRCTKSHEYLFLLTKSPRYFYDAAAIAEPTTPDYATSGRHRRPDKVNGAGFEIRGGLHVQEGASNRNKRSVWTVATQPYSDAHFATFPPKLIEPCILAGSREGDTVLDPFGGSGTTGEVANRLGRHSILIELNPAYRPLIETRTAQQGLPLGAA